MSYPAKAQETMVPLSYLTKSMMELMPGQAGKKIQIPPMYTNSGDVDGIESNWKDISQSQLVSMIRECFEHGFYINLEANITIQAVNHSEPLHFIAEAILHGNSETIQGQGRNVREAIRSLYYHSKYFGAPSSLPI